MIVPLPELLIIVSIFSSIYIAKDCISFLSGHFDLQFLNIILTEGLFPFSDFQNLLVYSTTV